MIEIEINGKKTQVAEGTMIIQAADDMGIYIPRFCYHKKLSIVANCRMCLVEVEGSRKALPACATPVANGMKIFTQSKVALDAQKAVMEFLLINHPLDCPICDQGGECELQDLAMGYGKGVSRFTEGKRSVFDEDLGPLVATDMTRCIHCTRCVRFGTEIAGMPELGATGRGEDLRIGTYVKHGMKSELSGNVIDLCPVGALTNKPFRFRARSWHLQQSATVSPHDCVGSNMYLHSNTLQYSAYREVMRVVPKDNEAVNENWLSNRDRYSYQGIHSEDRVPKPRIKQNGKWREVDWLTALNFAQDHLKGIINQFGADQIGSVISHNATMEEQYLMQKLTRGMGSHNVDHRLRQVDCSHEASAPTMPLLGLTFTELEQRDAIFVVGSYVRHDQPLANHRIRKASLRGAKVMMLNAFDYDYNFNIDEKLISDVRSYPEELAAILKACGDLGATLPKEAVSLVKSIKVNQTHTAIAKHLMTREKASIVVGASAHNHPIFSAICGLAVALSEVTGASVGCLTDGANTAGAWLAGAIPHREETGRTIATPGLNVTDMFEHKLKAYMLFNVEPELDCASAHHAERALESAEFVVVMSPYTSEAIESYANVILPIATFAETSGTYINAQGDWQSFKGATEPWEDARPGWKVLRVLGNLFDIPEFSFASTQDVLEKLTVESKAMIPRGIEWTLPASVEVNKDAIYRITDWPMERVDNVVRRAKALQDTLSAHYDGVVIHPNLAQKLDVHAGAHVMVTQEGQQREFPVVIDSRISENNVLIYAAMQASSGFGSSYGEVTIERSE